MKKKTNQMSKTVSEDIFFLIMAWHKFKGMKSNMENG